ncbi:MAG: ABC transporter permease subunit, partial [Mycobacteriales bacterium]
LIAPVSLMPARLAAVFGFQALVEWELNYPGLGTVFISGALTQDYYTTIGGILVIAIAIVVVSLAADVLLAALDPRIRLVGPR